MSVLSDSLQQLLAFLERWGQMPPLQGMRLVEIRSDTPLDERGRLRIRQQELRTPADYEHRFEELINLGLPWINESCYGVHDSILIVGIEIPDISPKERGVPHVSINYSGPPDSVVQHGWDASEVMVIEN